MNVNERRVYFALDGDDFDPDEVTKFIGIEPTSVMRKGSKAGGKSPKVSSWTISTENVIDEYIDVLGMATEIVSLLKPKKKVIIQAIEKFNVKPRLEVVLWFSFNGEHSTPANGFEPDTVSFLGEIGAFIDIDTYKY